jgi:DNA-binding transcriptional LysR family regulator
VKLRSFERVARMKSFTRAAEALHLAQPALSKQVAALERELGTKLFERSAPHGTLTPAGRRLLEHADRILEEYATLQADVIHALQAGWSELRIGASANLSDYVLPSVIAAILARYPTLSVQVLSRARDELVQEVANGWLHAAICMAPPRHGRVTSEIIFDEDVCLLLPPDHVWVGRDTVSFAELPHVATVIPTPGALYREIVEPAVQATGIQLHPRVSVDSREAAIHLVRTGVGVAPMPRLALDGNLPYARLVDPEIKRPVAWLQREGTEMPLQLREFREVLRGELARHASPVKRRRRGHAKKE